MIIMTNVRPVLSSRYFLWRNW